MERWGGRLTIISPLLPCFPAQEAPRYSPVRDLFEEQILRIFSLILLLAIALLQLIFIHPAQAGDSANGRGIFQANCASCHIGGGNILIEHKTLQKPALLTNLSNFDLDPVGAIIQQVRNGKGAMPAFKDKLSGEKIFEVATYVFQESENGWK
jgi:cytochrome c6